MSTTIFVKLLDEAVDVWRPVEAEAESDGAFRIVASNPDSDIETWEFATGERVLCRLTRFAGGEVRLAAFARAEGH